MNLPGLGGNTAPQTAPATTAPETPAPAAPQQKMITVRVLRDRWDDLGNRQEKGRVMDVPLDESVIDAIEKGTMERYKKSKDDERRRITGH